jgi:hypothetical protein
MSVIEIIRLIGIVCWLFHKAHHVKLFDAMDPPSEDYPEGRQYQKWCCLKCNGPSWEVEA